MPFLSAAEGRAEFYTHAKTSLWVFLLLPRIKKWKEASFVQRQKSCPAPPRRPLSLRVGACPLPFLCAPVAHALVCGATALCSVQGAQAGVGGGREETRTALRMPRLRLGAPGLLPRSRDRLGPVDCACDAGDGATDLGVLRAFLFPGI